MSTQSIAVHRIATVLKPDQTRVLLRPFNPGGPRGASRIISRGMALPERHVGPLLKKVCDEFCTRHEELPQLFLERFDEVRGELFPQAEFSEERRQLIGSYFLAEYSLESAALFNPSIVPHIDQSGLPAGALRFVLSLRATGEGHVSSITFRTGIIHADQRIEICPAEGFLTEAKQIPNPRYEKGLFERKLRELRLAGDFTSGVMEALGECFALAELRASIDRQRAAALEAGGLSREARNAARGIWAVAQSNYEVQFEAEQQFAERILFPATASQRHGIEDARFVRFDNGDGTYMYYATFTAFDGRVVMPELLETADFLRFRFLTLNGPAAQNKGMALFPRKINGRFAMLSRQDNENIHLMFSDNVHFWDERQVLLKPAYPWEMVQLGNCGSPIETEAGWLVLSHGVGPMRTYSIGAFLLDREDPSKVIGHLREPLLHPNRNEREGYVPNVVYTCGSLVHNGTLIIPYGLADHATSFATVALADVLGAMRSVGARKR